MCYVAEMVFYWMERKRSFRIILKRRQKPDILMFRLSLTIKDILLNMGLRCYLFWQFDLIANLIWGYSYLPDALNLLANRQLDIVQGINHGLWISCCLEDTGPAGQEINWRWRNNPQTNLHSLWVLTDCTLSSLRLAVSLLCCNMRCVLRKLLHAFILCHNQLCHFHCKYWNHQNNCVSSEYVINEKLRCYLRRHRFDSFICTNS